MKARASRKSLGGVPLASRPLSGVELARQWAKADLFSPSFAGCVCAGGFHAPLDASQVAQDLLIYLEDKYRSSGQAALAALLEQSLGRAADFGDWLASLDQEILSAQERALLMSDLQTTLDSMSGSRGFACT